MAIKAQFSAGQTEIKVQSLHQWDYGQQLEIEAVDIPESVIQVHFACQGMSEAIIHSCAITGGTGVVSIPDRCLEQTTPITAWIYEVETIDGVVKKCTTTKTITIPIVARIRPGRGEEEVPETVEDAITELITQINGAIDKINTGEVIAKRAHEANKAEHATTAGTATRAGSADTASVATIADSARTAGNATNADNVKPKKVFMEDAEIITEPGLYYLTIGGNALNHTLPLFVPEKGKYVYGSSFAEYNELGALVIYTPVCAPTGEVYVKTQSYRNGALSEDNIHGVQPVYRIAKFV